MTEPTLIEQPTTAAREGAKAKWWRKTFARMTKAELAALTGCTIKEINCFERGYGDDGKRIEPDKMNQYRMVCAGLCFDWDRTPNRTEK